MVKDFVARWPLYSVSTILRFHNIVATGYTIETSEIVIAKHQHFSYKKYLQCLHQFQSDSVCVFLYIVARPLAGSSVELDSLSLHGIQSTRRSKKGTPT